MTEISYQDNSLTFNLLPEFESYPYKLSKVGRGEIMVIDGRPELIVTHNIDQDFPPQYTVPEWAFDTSCFTDFFQSLQDDDNVSAVRHMERCLEINNDLTVVKNSSNAYSLTDRSYDYSMINSAPVTSVAALHDLKPALLNPSPGTIARYSKEGIKGISIHITAPPPMQDFTEYKNRIINMVSNTGWFSSYPKRCIKYKKWRQLSFDHMYYCGFHADQAELHGVKNFYGLELNPYVCLSKGIRIANFNEVFKKRKKGEGTEMFSHAYRFSIEKKGFLEEVYYIKEPRAFRYLADVVMHSFNNFKKIFHVNAYNGIYNVLSTVKLHFPVRKDFLVTASCMPFDAYYCNGKNYRVKNEVLYCHENNRVFKVDVLLPYDFNRRQSILRTLDSKVPIYPWKSSSVKATLVASPAFTPLVKLSEPGFVGITFIVKPAKNLRGFFFPFTIPEVFTIQVEKDFVQLDPNGLNMPALSNLPVGVFQVSVCEVSQYFFIHIIKFYVKVVAIVRPGVNFPEITNSPLKLIQINQELILDDNCYFNRTAKSVITVVPDEIFGQEAFSPFLISFSDRSHWIGETVNCSPSVSMFFINNLSFPYAVTTQNDRDCQLWMDVISTSVYRPPISDQESTQFEIVDLIDSEKFTDRWWLRLSILPDELFVKYYVDRGNEITNHWEQECYYRNQSIDKSLFS